MTQFLLVNEEKSMQQVQFFFSGSKKQQYNIFDYPMYVSVYQTCKGSIDYYLIEPSIGP